MSLFLNQTLQRKIWVNHKLRTPLVKEIYLNINFDLMLHKGKLASLIVEFNTHECLNPDPERFMFLTLVPPFISNSTTDFNC